MTSPFAPAKKKTLPLMIDLTEDELLKVGQEVSHAIDLFDRLSARKKRAVKKFGDRIKRADTAIRTFNEQLRTKKRETLVDVEDRPDLFAGKMKTHRLDTDEVVAERPLSPDEKQLSLGAAASMSGQGNGPSAKVIGIDTAKADDTRAGQRARAESDVDEVQAVAETPEEAEALRAQRAAAEIEGAYSDAVRTAVGSLLSYNTKLTEHTGDGDTKFFVAKVDGPGWVAEADGDTRDGAVLALKKKLLEKYAADEAELAKLTTDQAEDAKKNAPKNLLKAPKGKKAKRMRVQGPDGKEIDLDTITDEKPTGVEPLEKPELCLEECAIEHAHTEQRVPF